jgi:hypothetical protein
VFFGSDVNQACAQFLELSLIWLQLSHALSAVRSPSAAQKFNDQNAAREQIGE